MASKKTLTPVEQLALLKFSTGTDDGDKAVRAAVGPGQYEIDTTIRIHGTLNIGEDFSQSPRISLPTTSAICIVMEQLKIDKKKFGELIQKAMTKAGNEDAQISSARMVEFGIETAVATYANKIKTKAGKTIAKGHVKATLFAEKVK